MTRKQRLSASVDTDLLAAAQAAVAHGRAENVSAWVNDALRMKADHDARMEALDAFLASYEAENGVISQDEIDDAYHEAKARAVVIRADAPRPRRGVA